MTEHPLTDDFCYQIVEDWPPEDDVEKDNMRTAADWQLEQVTKWLDENLSNYTDDPYNDDLFCLHLWMRDDLKKAMRPTQENN